MFLFAAYVERGRCVRVYGAPIAGMPLARFMPAEIAAAAVEFVVAAENDGSPVTDTFERVLGRPPVTFRRWALEHAADFR